MKAVVVNADDFGIRIETNLAVELAHRQGLLTSASLMPNMPAFEHAVHTVLPRNPELGMGVHLVLTSGRPVSDAARLPLLVDESGCFRHGFLGLWRLVAGPRRRAALDQIAIEIRAQMDRMQGAGVTVDHIDSHQHIHMIPAVWRLVDTLSRRSVGATVRLGADLAPLWRALARPRRRLLTGNVCKRLVLSVLSARARTALAAQGAGKTVRHPDRIAGVMDSGLMDRRALRQTIEHVTHGVTEIVTHPSLAPMHHGAGVATCCSRADMVFLSSLNRQTELEALLDPSLRRLLAEHEIRVGSFRTLTRSVAGWAGP